MHKSYFRSTLSAHKLTFFLIVALAVTTVAGAVLLTPGSGVSATPAVIGTFVDPTGVKFKIKGGSQEVINVNDAANTVMHEISIQPASNNGGLPGHTGWHSHPGPVVVLIKSGTMSFYDGDDPTCTVRTYTAGQAFIDSGQGHVHIARNEGSVPLVLAATYFDVPAASGSPWRINADNPENCVGF